MWTQIRGYPLQAFIVCHLAYMFSQVDLALFSYALPSIRETFDVSLQAMGWVVALSYSSGAILQVYIGTLTDRFGRKQMLMLITVVSSLFIAGHAIVPESTAQLVVGGVSFSLGIIVMTLLRTFAIASGGALYPTTGAIVTEESPARYRGIMAGLLQTAFPLGAFVAALFAAPVLDAYGWRPLFLVGLLSIPFIWVIHKFLRETSRFVGQKAEAENQPPADHSSRAKIAALFAPEMRERTLTLFSAQFIFVIAFGAASVWLPTYLVESRGFTQSDATYIVGYANAIAVVGYVIAAVTGEFILTRRTTVTIFTLLGATSFLCMVWLTSGYWQTLIVLSISMIFFYGTAAVKFAYIAEVFPTHVRATGLAVCSSLAVNLGIAFGPLVVTYGVAFFDWDMTLSVVVGVPLAVAGLLYLRLKPVPSGLEVEEVDRRMRTQS
ncbi:MAG: MFS transporter [Rhodospirillaceae bacterium]|jgi:MFS family permease|nr:MFS transporter [Rhodospirillaceae bacterium]MBT5241193.1 MFS transporter [Rhodospirillaceae bacterium]MBT6088194.1 MFS transporter [Rhodospirillaceae bacterium]